MQIIADLHLHSRFSRAVSQKMDLFETANWAQKKGIKLIATGDWMHPVWFKEISTNLKEKEAGIFALAKDNPKINFLLSTEISSIYTQGDKVRRIHNLIFSPSLKTCETIVKELQKRGVNLMSDGRPIVGLSARELAEIVLTVDKNALIIPAHAWTPWFSIFGSNSGFDSIEECFGDMAQNIYAVETGLSSDPIMNWQIKELDGRSILSFSDAHSGPKLGREATVFVPKTNPKSDPEIIGTKFSYEDIADAIKQDMGAKLKVGYTIEFFPQEGKYHWSGHRNCGVKYSPKDTKEKGMICPVCQKKLTIGVENRVLDLAHKSLPDEDLAFVKNSVGTTFVYDKEKKRIPFVSAVPLLEILLEVNSGSATKAEGQYESLVSTLGSEFDILIKKSPDELESVGGAKLAQAISLVRERKVYVDPGFDGVFGKVKIFADEKTEGNQAQSSESQLGLF